MMRRTLGLALSMVLLAAAPAAARTLVVDDDGGCADARYTTIQSAVDVARPGDVVRVCPGEYHEEVSLHQSRVTLRSRVPLAATIVGSIRAVGDGYLIRGLTVHGEVSGSYRDECDGAAITLYPDGEYRPGPHSVIVGNHVTQATCATPSTADHTAGIRIDDITGIARDTLIVRNVVEHAAGIGIAACTYSHEDIHDNHVVGAGGDGIVVCGNSNVRSNTVTGSRGDGIAGFGYEVADAFRIVANRLDRNYGGIAMSDIGAGVDGADRSFVERNRVTNSDTYGIADFSGVGYVTYRGNRASGSGSFDCYDSYKSGGYWVPGTNIGATASPRSICRPPG